MHLPSRPVAPRSASLLALCAMACGAQGAQPGTHRFEVLLDGKPIGTHEFLLTGTPEGHSVRSTARFDVRLLGITVYRYRHEALEQWQDGCLRRIDAETRDDGRPLVVSGAQEAGGFRLERPAARSSQSPCVVTYAYWDPTLLLAQRQLLNPQTGEFDAVQFEPLGEERIEVQGSSRLARRYRLRSDALAIDLWYSPEGQWLQLASPARGNRQLLYRRR